MRFGNNDDNKFSVGDVRQSQMITTFGIGSMVDFVNQTVMICGIDKWNWATEPQYKFNNINLQSMLGVDFFVKPKTSVKENFWDKKQFDVPAVVFPQWLYSPSCKRLVKASKSNLTKDKYLCYCDKCRGKNSAQLLPSRFVLVCPSGHIEDFPYDWWVHEGQGQTCTCNKPELKMYYVGNKTDMDSLFIECASCGAKRSMKGASAKNSFSNYHCHGSRPWLGENEQCPSDMKDPKEPMQMRIRNESSVYFPSTVSALSIPPWSSKLAKKLQSFLGAMKLTDETRKYVVTMALQDYPEIEYNDALSLLKKLETKSAKTETMQDIMEDEYTAILSHRGDGENSDYDSHEEAIAEPYEHIIDKVIAIDRLTVVTAMIGFTRLIAPADYNVENLAPLSKTKKNWYPAVEQKGEGIFIKFNQDMLSKWTTKVGTRYDDMQSRLEESFFANDKFSPQYVFLHTFAHLFIRELANLCGYSAASLKERIYSTYANGEKQMAGVLIYTSSSDADGSLGGLTEQAQTINMKRIINSMLERAKWCSSDPVCYSTKQQGFMSLNYAACFACTLLPETSCEFRNVLLDRCAVVGNPENPDIGLMNWRKQC